MVVSSEPNKQNNSTTARSSTTESHAGPKRVEQQPQQQQLQQLGDQWSELYIILLIYSFALEHTVKFGISTASRSWSRYGYLVETTVKAIQKMRWNEDKSKQVKLVLPHKLADKDSMFRWVSFGSPAQIRMHCKKTEPRSGHVAEERKGVFCLHGLLGTTFSWHYIQQDLADSLQLPVVSYDRVGFGITSRPLRHHWEDHKPHAWNPYTFDASVDQLHQLIESFGFDKVVLVAHSLGSATAMLFAKKYPNMVDSLILISPALSFLNTSIMANSNERNLSSTKQVEVEKSSGGKTSNNGKGNSKSNSNSNNNNRTNKTSSVLPTSALPSNLLQTAPSPFSVLESMFKFALSTPIAMRFMQSRFEHITSSEREFIEQLRQIYHADLDHYQHMDIQRVYSEYTRPMLCKDWDISFMEFLMAFEPNRNILDECSRFVQQPMLVILGDQDLVLNINSMKSITKHIKQRHEAPSTPSSSTSISKPPLQQQNGSFVPLDTMVIPNCAHAPMEEYPDQVLQYIREWYLTQHGNVNTNRPDSLILNPYDEEARP